VNCLPEIGGPPLEGLTSDHWQGQGLDYGAKKVREIGERNFYLCKSTIALARLRLIITETIIPLKLAPCSSATHGVVATPLDLPQSPDPIKTRRLTHRLVGEVAVGALVINPLRLEHQVFTSAAVPGPTQVGDHQAVLGLLGGHIS